MTHPGQLVSAADDHATAWQRVRGILGSWYERHRFYLDADNDDTALDNIAAEICRALEEL